jgi:hypothetical protein
MSEHIEWFITTILRVGGFRVWSEAVFRLLGLDLFRMNVAEWLRDGRWEVVELSDDPSRLPPLRRDRRVA